MSVKYRLNAQLGSNRSSVALGRLSSLMLLHSPFTELLDLSLLLLEHVFNRERNKLVASALVELVLELNPMQSESMEEGLHEIHQH